MSYTPHVWANGQNGADAVTLFNNIEEGIRAATEAAENVGAEYDAADPESIVSRASAARQDAADAKTQAQNGYNAVSASAALLSLRNANDEITNNLEYGPGTDIPIYFGIRWRNISKPESLFSVIRNYDNYTLEILKPGWFMFYLTIQVMATNAIFKMLCNGLVVDTCQIIDTAYISEAKNQTTAGICITRYFEQGDLITYKCALESFPDGVEPYVHAQTVLRRL